MLKNDFTVAWRAINRHKFHTLINITGLSVGISCCLIIFLFVKDEWTFDHFHQKADRVYRAWVYEYYGENEEFINTVTPIPLAEALAESYPEIEKVVRIDVFNSKVSKDNLAFNERVTMVSPGFLEVFDFPLQEGLDTEVFKGKHSVVITEDIARKYFGTSHAVGNILSITLRDREYDFVIKGVAGKIPGNSSIQFDILIPEENSRQVYNETSFTSWFEVSGETYLLLHEDVDASLLEDKFPTMLTRYLGAESLKESNYKIGLQPLKDIHLNLQLPPGIVPVSDPSYSYLLAFAALFIVVIAGINFTTLTIGKSMARIREVGVRKAAGAGKTQLIRQFLVESLVITMVALMLAVIATFMMLPAFNAFTGKAIVPAFSVNNLLIVAGFGLMVGALAGLYPALVLSNADLITSLKGKTGLAGKKNRFNKYLVVIQFVLSTLLISGTLLMKKQLNFMQDKNLGFDREQVVVIPMNLSQPEGQPFLDFLRDCFQKSAIYQQKVLAHKDVVGTSSAAQSFGQGDWIYAGFTDDRNNYRNFYMNIIDANYIDMMGMEIVAGKGFDGNNTANIKKGVVINESFMSQFGLASPIGKRLPSGDFGDHEIIGVVKDFNFASLHHRVQPLLMTINPGPIFKGIENADFSSSPVPKINVRIRAQNLRGTVDFLKESWVSVFQDQDINLSFLDETINRQYEAEQRLSKLINFGSILAMFIASLGLIGLASFTLAGRTKEIGIRKILGSSVSEVLILLAVDFLKLVSAGVIIAVPITYYFTERWLRDFDYRIGIGIAEFIFTAALVLMIAMAAIAYHTVKASRRNPIESLRYE